MFNKNNNNNIYLLKSQIIYIYIYIYSEYNTNSEYKWTPQGLVHVIHNCEGAPYNTIQIVTFVFLCFNLSFLSS